MPSFGVALVLGAGGPVGQAFHAGVLKALWEVCGWDARDAELIVGTSAGAHAGAWLRSGLSPHDFFGRLVSGESHLPLSPALPGRRWPSSPAYLRSALRRPWQARPGRLVSALLPEGTQGNESIGHAFARLFSGGWPTSPLWIPAVHLDSGARVVFGQPGAPVVDVGMAVRCSSAVPALRRPVQLGEHRYIDGGIASPTHLDLVEACELVVVSSPLSRVWPLQLLLGTELRRLRRRGVRVALFEPDRDTRAAMGWSFMNTAAAPGVAHAAHRGARRLLEESARLRALLVRSPLSAVRASAERMASRSP